MSQDTDAVMEVDRDAPRLFDEVIVRLADGVSDTEPEREAVGRGDRDSVSEPEVLVVGDGDNDDDTDAVLTRVSVADLVMSGLTESEYCADADRIERVGGRVLRPEIAAVADGQMVMGALTEGLMDTLALTWELHVPTMVFVSVPDCRRDPDDDGDGEAVRSACDVGE